MWDRAKKYWLNGQMHRWGSTKHVRRWRKRFEGNLDQIKFFMHYSNPSPLLFCFHLSPRLLSLSCRSEVLSRTGRTEPKFGPDLSLAFTRPWRSELFIFYFFRSTDFLHFSACRQTEWKRQTDNKILHFYWVNVSLHSNFTKHFRTKIQEIT